jgi:hypothetical protein
MKAALFHTDRMRGAVPAKKSENKKQTKSRVKADLAKSRNLPDGSARKDPKDAEEKDKAPKKGSRTLRSAARKVKQAIPDIVDKMVEEAKKGNVQHLKTVLQCTGVDKLLEQECQPRKQKSLAELLIRRLEKPDKLGESDGTGTESE